MVIRRNKKHINPSIIISKTRSESQARPLQDQIYDFIKENPNCTRRQIYENVIGNESDIRQAITSMQRQHRIRETFNIGSI